MDSVYKSVLGNSCISVDRLLHTNTDRQTDRRLQQSFILQHTVYLELEVIYNEGIYQSTRRNIVENLNLQQIHLAPLSDYQYSVAFTLHTVVLKLFHGRAAKRQNI